MEDLVKCTGVGCEIRKNCFRYLEREKNDLYLSYIPYDEDIEDCEYFYGINHQMMDEGIERAMNGTN